MAYLYSNLMTSKYGDISRKHHESYSFSTLISPLISKEDILCQLHISLSFIEIKLHLTDTF